MALTLKQFGKEALGLGSITRMNEIPEAKGLRHIQRIAESLAQR
jgi:hypothetical protein